MLNKCLGYILSVCILCGNVLSVTAVNSSKDLLSYNRVLDEAELKEAMLRILSSVEFEKDNYGLSDLNFSNIMIGEKIPTYEIIDNQLSEMSIEIYPILMDQTMISQFWASKDLDTNEWYVQLDNSLVTTTVEKVGFMPYCYIYAKEGLYIYSEGEIALVGAVGRDLEDYENLRESIGQITKETLENTSLSSNELFGTLNVVSGEILTKGVVLPQVSAYCNVEKIQQPVNTDICWAISMASILNYINDTNLTYQSVINTCTNGNPREAFSSEVVVWMNEHYSAGYVKSTNSPEATKVIDELIAGYPSFGAFLPTTGTQYHAVVIRGCDLGNGTFSVMNPTPTTTSYTTGSITSSNVWKFISTYNGYTYTLQSRVYKS